MRKSGAKKPRVKTVASPRRSVRWETQRQALIAAAQRAIRKKGAGASMDDIAAEARVAKPILYRHFGDRAGLARALGESVLLLSSSGDKAQMLERLSAFYPTVDSPEDLLRVFQGFLGQYSTFVEMDTPVYRFLQSEQALQRLMQDAEGGRQRNPVAQSVARSLVAILEEGGRDPRPAELWAHALVALAGGAIEWWAENKPFHRFDLERYIVDLAWHGIQGVLARSAPAARKTTARTSSRRRATRGRR